jgi:hypothetical protein
VESEIILHTKQLYKEGDNETKNNFFLMGTGAKHPTKTASIQLAGATITKRPKRFGKIQTRPIKLQEGPYIYSRT